MVIRKAFWLAGSSLIMMPTVVQAQQDAAETLQNDAAETRSPDQQAQDIVITGSRVITNGNNSPTPVTVVTLTELQQTTPSNVPDALRKLPVFGNSRNASTLGNAGANNVGNFLNLRSFGIIRTLILFDGRRVPATNADGTVDTNVIPQLLTQRVDVVTGGASAVYGSDAVTGVVNFVLDKKFNGLKVNAQSGISSRGDAFSWRAGIAGGTDLFDGNAHFEASYEHYSSDGLPDKLSRKAGQMVYSENGAGTAANPFHLIANARAATSSFGGLILSGPLAGQQFVQPGVVGPFVHGTPSGTAGIESGGDGAYLSPSSAAASLKTDQLFARYDMQLGDNIEFFAQGTFARSENHSIFVPYILFGSTISSTNAFLSPALQAQLSAGGNDRFVFARYVQDVDPAATRAVAENLHLTTGLAGNLGAFNWEVSYTHGRTEQTVTNINNVNQAKQAAALDAVMNNGQVVCNVTITNPGLYPGCVPLNPFGRGTVTKAMADYIRDDTQFVLTNSTDDVNASITGSLFDTWAGPVRMALSGEYRELKLSNVSSIQPSDLADCTGLRFNCVPASSTSNGTTLYSGNTTANMLAKQNIAEVAFEANVPLLKDSAVARSLDLNGAVRYAHYSVSGNATTWKVGLDWHLTDDLSFRGTRSRDIRAPTLNDLFSPVQQSLTGFTDTHTNTAGTATIITSGNPDLVPEVANTITLGGVYKPSWLPGFSVAIDYYKIEINNAISGVGGNNASTLAQCEASNGTSPLCDLYVRPLPFSDRTSANYPIRILARGLNLATTWTEGVDAEVNYQRELGAGRLSLRGLVSYQPVLSTIQFANTAPINSAGVAGQQGGGGVAKWRATAFVGYSTDQFSIDVQERFRSSLKPSGNSLLVFADPDVPAVAYTDLNLSAYFGPNKSKQLFVSVQNVFDQAAPVFISTAFASSPNFYYPAVNEDDIIGRYFTVGFRAKF